MITLKELRDYTAAMPDDTRLGISFDEELERDVLAFQEPLQDGMEDLLDVGELEPLDAYESA